MKIISPISERFHINESKNYFLFDRFIIKLGSSQGILFFLISKEYKFNVDKLNLPIQGDKGSLNLIFIIFLFILKRIPIIHFSYKFGSSGFLVIYLNNQFYFFFLNKNDNNLY